MIFKNEVIPNKKFIIKYFEAAELNDATGDLSLFHELDILESEGVTGTLQLIQRALSCPGLHPIKIPISLNLIYLLLNTQSHELPLKDKSTHDIDRYKLYISLKKLITHNLLIFKKGDPNSPNKYFFNYDLLADLILTTLNSMEKVDNEWTTYKKTIKDLC